MHNLVKVAPLVAAAVFSITALRTAPAYADDPDNDGSDPGYVVDGGSQPGLEHYPAICAPASEPLACALHYNPGPGTWTRPAPEPLH